MKTLAELQAECTALGLTVTANGGRASEGPYIIALRDHHWRRDHPDEPLPPQVSPMLPGDWGDLDPEEARRIEQGEPGWIVQPKLDGIRALLHVEGGRVRITSRCVSEVTYRLGEFQDHLPHLTDGLFGLAGTILDGELIFPASSLDTGQTVAWYPLRAARAILSSSPDQACRFQPQSENRLRFQAFDILKYRDAGLTHSPLWERLNSLARAIADADHPYLESVPSYALGQLEIHRRGLEAGGEGTVWKRLDRPYEPGRRVAHWLKRKSI
jgi:DNA ligase-1